MGYVNFLEGSVIFSHYFQQIMNNVHHEFTTKWMVAFTYRHFKSRLAHSTIIFPHKLMTPPAKIETCPLFQRDHLKRIQDGLPTLRCHQVEVFRVPWPRSENGGTVGLCLMGRVGKISWCRSKTSNGFETTRYCILLDILQVDIDLICKVMWIWNVPNIKLL